MTAKILIWDIETFPNIMARHSLWHQGDPNSILQEKSIICSSYRFVGEKKVKTLSILDDRARFKKDMFDDTYVLREMRKVIEQADMLVHHNGDKFDLKVFNGRCAIMGIEPTAPVLCYDTLKVAKRLFKFNSNRLDYLGKVLGVGGKEGNRPGLWMDCVRGKISAIHEMEKYNRRDITLLEDVYKKLVPYDHQHPNMNIISDVADILRCPLCQSPSVVKWGHISTRTQKYQRYRCKSCGKYSKGRKTVVDTKMERLV